MRECPALRKLSGKDVCAKNSPQPRVTGWGVVD